MLLKTKLRSRGVMSKKRYFVNLAIIVIFASLTGFFAGNYYVKNYTGTVLAVTESEEEVRGNDVKNTLKKAKGKTPANLTSVENFILAENNLNQKDYIYKEVTGKITAAGVTQGLHSFKVKKDGYIMSEKVSSSKFVKVADRTLYQIGSDGVNYYKGSDITSSYTASWKNTPTKVWTLDDYRDKYGANPEAFIGYVIGTKTTLGAKSTAPKLLPNGNYECTIVTDTYYSVMNYMYEIRTTSGSSNFPRMESSTITFEITPDWEFVSISYKESYSVSIAVLGYTKCSGSLAETFSYDGAWQNPLV